jgi:peptidoglycan/xylan/chitin deacetylase (PgdA/CDA1 family)
VPAAEIGERRSRPCVAITFDDGYADNAEVAAPALIERGLPATFFVTSDGFLSGREFWWDHIDHVMRGPVVVDELAMVVGTSAVRLDFRSRDTRLAGLKLLNRVLVRQHPTVVAEVLARLDEVSSGSYSGCDPHRLMTIGQLTELAAVPQFEIGSHTCSHSALAALSNSESLEELVSSRRWLGDTLGRLPRLVAYPYGAPRTLRRRNAAQAAEAGYTGGFVNVRGPADGAPPHVVPRVAVGEWEPNDLLALVSLWQR